MKNFKLMMMTLIMSLSFMVSFGQSSESFDVKIKTGNNIYTLCEDSSRFLLTIYAPVYEQYRSMENEVKPILIIDHTSMVLVFKKSFTDPRSLYEFLSNPKLKEDFIAYTYFLQFVDYTPTPKQIDLRLKQSSDLLVKSQNLTLAASIIIGIGAGLSFIPSENPSAQLLILAGTFTVSSVLGVSSFVVKRKAYKKLRF